MQADLLLEHGMVSLPFWSMKPRIRKAKHRTMERGFLERDMCCLSFVLNEETAGVVLERSGNDNKEEFIPMTPDYQMVRWLI